MEYKRTIVSCMAFIALLFAATATGTEKGQSADVEQIAAAQSYAEIKCDPCDYNFDYGDAEHPADAGVDEGTVKLECDPCDYNVDYESRTIHE